MFTPAYKLTVGGKSVDTTDEPQASTVTDLSVSLGGGGSADRFVMLLGNVGGLSPARDDETKIELGYADGGGTTQVIAGAVWAVEPNLTTTRVVGYGDARKTLRTFVNNTYERKTAGAIVRDLAGQAEVEVEAAEDGVTLPAFVVEGRRSVHAHMLQLAEFCGFDLYFNAAGRLVFERFSSVRTAHLYEFGKHLIALDVRRTPQAAGQVEVWGESATGSDGDDASAWVTTDFGGSKGSAGTGPLLLLERPAIRTRAAARTAAAAVLTDLQRRTLRGRLLGTGRPEVKLGDAIRLRGMSDDSLNTNFQVRGVTHRVTKSGGFTTQVDFRAVGA